jgi:hypothetical protein
MYASRGLRSILQHTGVHRLLMHKLSHQAYQQAEIRERAGKI